MLYFILILFLVSLLSIAVMLGRKSMLIKSGRISIQEATPFEIPYMREVRHLSIAQIKKYEHSALVVILRLYVQSTNLLRSTYVDIKNNLANRIKKNHINAEKAEVSKFLKMISDYTDKVRTIKHKIKEEEKSLEM